MEKLKPIDSYRDVGAWEPPFRAFLKAVGREDVKLPEGMSRYEIEMRVFDENAPDYDPGFQCPFEILWNQELFAKFVGFCLAKESQPLPEKPENGDWVYVPNQSNFELMSRYTWPADASGVFRKPCDYSQLTEGYELFKANPCDWDTVSSKLTL